MNKNRITKEEMFMKIASIVALRSTCKRKQVGAVVTDPSMLYVLSIGYNGNHACGPNTCDSDTEGNCGCCHAELNSLVKANNFIKDKILFVTLSPCKNCAKYIINSGFQKVYYHTEYRLKEGVELLRQMNIKVSQI